MINIILKLIGITIILSAITTVVGMKLVEWWECRR